MAHPDDRSSSSQPEPTIPINVRGRTIRQPASSWPEHNNGGCGQHPCIGLLDHEYHWCQRGQRPPRGCIHRCWHRLQGGVRPIERRGVTAVHAPTAGWRALPRVAEGALCCDNTRCEGSSDGDGSSDGGSSDGSRDTSGGSSYQADGHPHAAQARG